MIIIIAVFLAMSVLMETIGVWARVLGAFNEEPTIGYSTHVRIATMGRFFILISAPSLGFLVDQNVSPNIISIIGAISFLVIFLCILMFLYKGMDYFYIIYRILNRKKKLIKVPKNRKNIKISLSFFSFVFFSFLLTATGVIVVNYYATLIPEKRAMIVQMSSIVTMFGTIIHVFLIDPILSKSADQNKEELQILTMSFLYSRLIASFILFLVFLVLSLY